MSVADIVEILGGIAAIATLVLGLWEFRRKTDLQIFLGYTEKYNSIITPKIHEQWNKACKSPHPEDWEKLDEIAIAFLNLVWEEVYLHKTGVLRCNIWKIWLKEIKEVLDTDFGKRMMEKHGFKFLIQEVEKMNQA